MGWYLPADYFCSEKRTVSESVARGNCEASRNRNCPRANISPYFQSSELVYCFYYSLKNLRVRFFNQWLPSFCRVSSKKFSKCSPTLLQKTLQVSWIFPILSTKLNWNNDIIVCLKDKNISQEIYSKWCERSCIRKLYSKFVHRRLKNLKKT